MALPRRAPAGGGRTPSRGRPGPAGPDDPGLCPPTATSDWPVAPVGGPGDRVGAGGLGTALVGTDADHLASALPRRLDLVTDTSPASSPLSMGAGRPRPAKSGRPRTWPRREIRRGGGRRGDAAGVLLREFRTGIGATSIAGRGSSRVLPRVGKADRHQRPDSPSTLGRRPAPRLPEARAFRQRAGPVGRQDTRPLSDGPGENPERLLGTATVGGSNLTRSGPPVYGWLARSRPHRRRRTPSLPWLNELNSTRGTGRSRPRDASPRSTRIAYGLRLAQLGDSEKINQRRGRRSAGVNER